MRVSDDHMEDSPVCDADSGDGEQILDDPVLSQSIQSNKQMSSGVFKGMCTKYDLLETVDNEVDSDLANLVNNVFREGISDDKFALLVKETSHPENCTALTKTRVNSLVWNLLSPHMQTVDAKMQTIQECIIKAASIVTKVKTDCQLMKLNLEQML